MNSAELVLDVDQPGVVRDAAAARADATATTAKQRFVAVFNPLASSAHSRTWQAAGF